MDTKVRMLYRSSHYQMPIIAIIEDLNLFEKYGLDVNLIMEGDGEKAEQLLVSGGVDIVIGNHVAPMRDRARGVPIIYLAQANNWTQEKMITSDKHIKSLGDLKGKRVAIGTPIESRHPSLTVKLQLIKAGLDPDKGDVDFVPVSGGEIVLTETVLAGRADAAMVGRPYDLKAQKLGLKVLDIPSIPMICGTTVTTLSPYAQSNEDTIQSVIGVLINSIAYFKQNKAHALRILRERLSAKMKLEGDDVFEYMYSSLLDNLEYKPYPSLEAIRNVYQIALWAFPEAKDLNPLSMWDLHYVRKLDEQGFIEKIYNQTSG